MPDYKQYKVQSLMDLLGQGMGVGSAGAAQGIRGQQDLEKLSREQAFDQPFKQGALDVAKQNAATLEGYRGDQAKHMREQETEAKLKLLFGTGGGGGAGNGKPLSESAREFDAKADTTREALNAIETNTKAHPYATAASTVLPNFLNNFLGGEIKRASDMTNHAREGLTNLYTGAATASHQVPAYQGMAQPGFFDALAGSAGDQTATRDALNGFQKGLRKDAAPLPQNILQAAGLQNNPTAQALVQRQTQQQQAMQAERLAKMAPEDQELYKELLANDKHRNYQKGRRLLELKYGRIFQ